MADTERALLSRYGLTTAFPEAWPAEKDDEDDAEEQLHRLSTLASTRTVPRNLASHDDEPDPLGSSRSVFDVLSHRGGPIDDQAYRNRFLLSSTSFAPSTFLSEVHKDASTEQLLQGLHHLSQSIEQKSASLKLLVESNFERFVRAKTTIDNVYTEMKNHGQDSDSDQYSGTRPSLASRMATTRRMNDGPSNGYARYQDHNINQDKRKNALVKESDYGTQGIKLPLLDVTVKAEEVWGPALGGHEREETLKALLASFEKNRGVLEVEAAIEDCIKRHDYEAISKEYARAQRFANDARILANKTNEDQTRQDESRMYQIILTSRMWADVQERLSLFKQEAWRKLMETATTKRLPRDARKTNDLADLTSILLQIGVDDNPIFSWLTKRRAHLQERITNSFERSRVELEIYRRRLNNGSDVTEVQLASHLRVAVSPPTAEIDSVHLDRVQIIQFWHHLQKSLELLLSSTDGILGEVIEYYETTQSFVGGFKQKAIPDATGERSQTHRRLSGEEVRDVEKGILDLCAYIQSQVHTLFTQAPDEDMSALLSPTSPVSKVPQSARILAKQMQISLSKSGKQWDLLSYWPPYSNCRSAAYFLRAIITQVCNAAIEMTSLHVVNQDASLMQMLRGSISDIREGIITAVTTAWVYDSGRCGDLEDWVRPVDKTDVTNMPYHLRTFEASMISDLQQIAYVSEIINAPGTRDIVKPPSNAQLETIQQAFQGSLFKAFGCIVERTSQAVIRDPGSDLMATSDVKAALQHSHGTPIDASDISVRKLLTMANCDALRVEVIPTLCVQFEASFSLHALADAQEVQDSLVAMHTRIFQSYVKPVAERLRGLIAAGVAAPSYGAGDARPHDARPYVYAVLLELVLVHAETQRTSPSALGAVLGHHLESVSQALIDAFGRRARYALPALVQATLDVEFLAQTLGSYTTARASEVQGRIYLALDERTDNDARQRLQDELPEMRAILKRLRERTRGEFACFKKARPARERDRQGNAEQA